MDRRRALAVIASLPLLSWRGSAQAVPSDDLSFLEEVHGSRALGWVAQQNARTMRILGQDSHFERFRQLAIVGERLAGESDPRGMLSQNAGIWIKGAWAYQLRSSAAHPRGHLRRTRLDAYLDGRPEWQLLLDLDRLSASEGRNWTLLYPQFSPSGTRCLVVLSLNNSGITIAVRELDLVAGGILSSGFALPPAQHQALWWDDETLLTTAILDASDANGTGYPIVARMWTRGTPLTDAKELFRGNIDDISLTFQNEMRSGGMPIKGGKYVVHLCQETANGSFIWHRLDADGRLRALTLAPLVRSPPTQFGDDYIFILYADWTVDGRKWPAGAVLSVAVSEIDNPVPLIRPILLPREDTNYSLLVGKTSDAFYIQGSYLAYGRIWRVTRHGLGWEAEELALPQFAFVLMEASDIRGACALVRAESLLDPPSLFVIKGASDQPVRIFRAEPAFDVERLTMELAWAVSADGTRVPYTLVRPKNMKPDGSAPTLTSGYGSRGANFGLSYSATLGRLWLEEGGIYAIAHVRGGRERGIAWVVNAAERRHTYADMAAVADELCRRQITRPEHLGFYGWSAGGLLGGVMLTRRPDLFSAIVLQTPVLDNFRLDLLVNGEAAWTTEFGAPNILKDRNFLLETSPQQQLQPGRQLPEPLLLTSTSDDTVLPSQSRRFAARMEQLGMPFLFHEWADGGHSLNATVEQRGEVDAMVYAYLHRRIGRTVTA